jgi:hypothetical protein
MAFMMAAGCNNSNSNQNAAKTPDTAGNATAKPEVKQEVAPTPVTMDMALLQKNATKAKEDLSGLKDLLKQIEALPASVKQSKSAQLSDFRNNLSGMIVKMQMVSEKLDRIAKEGKSQPAGAEASDQGSVSVVESMKYLKTISSDLDRYGEDVKNYQDAINQLKAGK